MKNNIRYSCVLLAATVLYFFTSPLAIAAPIRLDYSVIDMGGSFKYTFDLTLDNHDGSWVLGDNFNGIVFGDAPYDSNNLYYTPLADWVLDVSSLPIGPFIQCCTDVIGGHNGPYFIQADDAWTVHNGGWIPTTVGDSLHWSGTSSANLGQGDLLFSVLYGHTANFEVANLQPAPVPLPAAFWLVGSGLIGLFGFMRRRKTT